MGIKDWMASQGEKNAKNYLKNQRSFRGAINENNKDFINQLTPVKVVNAVHRALSAQGVTFETDKKANTTFVRECVVPKGMQQLKWTCKDAVLVLMGKPNTFRNGGVDISEIHYLTDSGQEKILSRSEITELLRPYYETAAKEAAALGPDNYLIAEESEFTDDLKLSLAAGVIVLSPYIISGIVKKIKELKKSKDEKKQEKARELEFNLRDKYFKEYLAFLDEVKNQFPKSAVDKERKLRNSEFDKVSNVVSKALKNTKKIYLLEDAYVDFSKDLGAKNPNLVFGRDEYDVKEFLDLSLADTDLLSMIVKEGDLSVFTSFRFLDLVSADRSHFEGMNKFQYIDAYLDSYWTECEKLWESVVKTVNSLNLKTISIEPEMEWDKDDGMGTIYLYSSEEFVNTCRSCGYMTFEEYCSSKGYH